MGYYLVDPEQLAKARGDQPAAIPSLGNAQPAQPMPATPGNEWQSLNDKWGIQRTDVSQAPSLDAMTPTGTTTPAKTLDQLAPSQLQAGRLVDNSVASPFTVTRENPQSLGMVDRSGTVTGADNVTRGWNNGTAEQFKTRYNVTGPNGANGVAEFIGAKPVGNGTVSVMDQGNGGTIEGNVAALNRQTAALTSLREAQNPGITTGTGAFAPRQEAPKFDPFGGDSNLKDQYNSLLSEAASETGFGASKRAARKIAAAQGLLTPGMAQMQSQTTLANNLNTNETARANSLNDLYAKNQITPYQQSQLGLEQQKLAQISGVKQTEAVNKGLDSVQTGIFGSPEWKNYITMKGQREITNSLANEDSPTAGHSLATAVAKASDPSTGVLSGEVEAIKSGSGNIFQRGAGWLNANLLGGSPFTPGVRQDLAKNVNIRADEYRNVAMEKINNMLPELKQRGIPLESVLQGSQLEDFKGWQSQRQNQNQQPQAAASYRWENGTLVPVQ